MIRQLRFLKDLSYDGTPIFYGGHCYDIASENDTMYKLFAEDMTMKGISKELEGEWFEVVK